MEKRPNVRLAAVNRDFYRSSPAIFLQFRATDDVLMAAPCLQAS